MTKQSNTGKIICPKCKSDKVKKRGLRKTAHRGKIQRYRCNSCKYSFCLDNGFFRMRNTPQKITLCMDLFYRGVSTRKVQEHLKMFYPHNCDHSTILRWLRKYAKMIAKFTDSLKLKCGEELQVDEMEHKTKSNKSWFIDAIDTQTRFMSASNYSYRRDQKEVKQVISTAKNKTQTPIKIIQTDGWLAYPAVIKRVFGYYNLKKGLVKHKKLDASKGDGFNVRIERLHNSIRERTKIFRSFKRLHSAKAIMKGYEIFYNFIRKHQAIDKCPYELATDLKLENPNKWLELIKLVKK